jgi:hypothetical protein
MQERAIFAIGVMDGIAGRTPDRRQEWSETQIRIYEDGYGKGYTERYEKLYRTQGGGVTSGQETAR